MSKRKVPEPPSTKDLGEVPSSEVPEEAFGERGDTILAPRRFGKGWVRDTHDTSKDQKTRHLFGARRGHPAEVSLEEFQEPPWDQVETSSCVGHADAAAVQIRCTKMAGGALAPRPSRAGIYIVALAVDRSSAKEPLRDEGCQPSQALRGMAEWGVPLEVDWPFDPEMITSEPDLEKLEHASAFLLHGFYRVDTDGNDRVQDICQALASGYPVVIGVEVDQAFEDYDGKGVVTAPKGKTFGGHMLCIVGYKPDPAHPGHTLFRIRNSWGLSWGDRGMAWADESFVTDAGAGDIGVITVSPR